MPNENHPYSYSCEALRGKRQGKGFERGIENVASAARNVQAIRVSYDSVRGARGSSVPPGFLNHQSGVCV